MAYYAGGRWYTDFVIDGDRHQEATDIKANTPAGKAKALKLQAERKVLIKVEAAKAAAETVRDKRGKVVDQTVADAFSAYWEQHAQHAKGAQDIFRYLARAERHFKPDAMISHIDTEAMIGLREARRMDMSGRSKTPTPISNRTVNITLEAVKFALAWLEVNGREVSKINWRVVLLEVDDRETKFTGDHHALVLKQFRKDMLPCLLFMLEAGPRVTQAVELRWSDVDLDAMEIRLKKQKKRGARKSPKEHIIPITTEIEALLLAQIDPETKEPYHPERVWTYVGDRTRTEKKSNREIVAGQRYPITKEGLTSRWVRFKKEHKLTDVRLHDMRHAAGTRIYRLTKDPLVTRDMLGHSNLAVTERYMHPTVEDMRKALNRRVHQLS